MQQTENKSPAQGKGKPIVPNSKEERYSKKRKKERNIGGTVNNRENEFTLDSMK